MKEIQLLSRNEMKKVLGGEAASGTCCAHDASWDHYTCELSISMAKDNASAFGNWCCDSCASSYFKARYRFIAMT